MACSLHVSAYVRIVRRLGSGDITGTAAGCLGKGTHHVPSSLQLEFAAVGRYPSGSDRLSGNAHEHADPAQEYHGDTGLSETPIYQS